MKSIKRLLGDKRGTITLAELAGGIIALTVICVVGVYITSEIYKQVDIGSDSPFNESMNSAINIMNTAFPLLVIVIIATVVGVIMANLLGAFGGYRGGGPE